MLVLCYNKLCHTWYLPVCQLFCRCLTDKPNSQVSRLSTGNITCREKMSGALSLLIFAVVYKTLGYSAHTASLYLHLNIILCLNSNLTFFQLRWLTSWPWRSTAPVKPSSPRSLLRSSLVLLLCEYLYERAVRAVAVMCCLCARVTGKVWDCRP